MTDRELLEYAAKAVGYTVDIWRPTCGDCVLLNEKGGHTVWNPLTDDGDALRLAVKLHMTLGSGVARSDAAECLEFECADEYAATRRAITRAAAEIGKGMP